MSQLVYDKDIRSQVSSLMRDSEVMRIAAPYWGSRAAKTLDIRRKKLSGSLHVICDLFAATTDPDSIRDLLNLGALVRINRDSHAKVYLGDKEAIVGSANVSGRAFTMAGSKPQHEMCVRVTDKASLKDLHTWWQQLWESSTPLEPDSDLTEQILAHAAYARSLEAQAQNLWDALRRDPEGFAEVYVVVDWEPYDQYVEQAVRDLNAGQQGIEYDAWQGWAQMPPSAELLSFCADDEHDTVEFQGIWKSPDKISQDKFGATYVTRLQRVRGYCLDVDDHIKAAATAYRDKLVKEAEPKGGASRKPTSSGGWMRLADFAKEYMDIFRQTPKI